jgi:hypothetical protein
MVLRHRESLLCLVNCVDYVMSSDKMMVNYEIRRIYKDAALGDQVSTGVQSMLHVLAMLIVTLVFV